jgi:hypothetical protein
MSSKSPSDRTKQVVKRLIEATDRTIAELEELKRARAALSLESTRPPLKIVRKEEAPPDED